MTMTDEQPEQWARELLEAVHDASDMGSACGMVDCAQCAKAALTIQRAFAEREAELVGALRAADQCLDEKKYPAQSRMVRQALQSREAGHG